MITSLSSGKYITVNGSSGSYYNNSSQTFTGMLRYHSGGRVEVFDGTSWMQVNSNQFVDLSPDTQIIIEWARSKMIEDQELEKLSQEHPAVKAAYENLNHAKEQLKATIILSKDEETTS
jgi:hypothetical protein